jgi:surface antigen
LARLSVRLGALSLAVAFAATGPADAQVRARLGFARGECTAWAYLKRPAIVDETELRSLSSNPASAITDWDAWLWASNARKGGFEVGRRPVLGAVAVWPRNTDGAGPLGHVAYVEKLLSRGAFLVSEQNWDGRRHPTHRVVAANSSLRFIYPARNEPQRVGSGRLIRFTGLGALPGTPATIDVHMSGRGNVLMRVTGPHRFDHESARVLPAGATTFTVLELAGRSRLPAGSYTLWLLVVGGGGSYEYLPLLVA